MGHKTTKDIVQSTGLQKKFHFHRSFEKVAGNVETMGPDLQAHVEGRQVWFADDEKPLLRAQHAGLGHWVEWCRQVML